MAKAKNFYYKTMGEEYGPVTGVEIRDKALEGVIVPDTPIRIGQEGKWVTAVRIKNLFDENGNPLPHSGIHSKQPPELPPIPSEGFPPEFPEEEADATNTSVPNFEPVENLVRSSTAEDADFLSNSRRTRYELLSIYGAISGIVGRICIGIAVLCILLMFVRVEDAIPWLIAASIWILTGISCLALHQGIKAFVDLACDTRASMLLTEELVRLQQEANRRIASDVG